MQAKDLLDQITFEEKSYKLMNGGTGYYLTVHGPAEINDVIETLNDLSAQLFVMQWDDMSAALDGDGRLPYWTGGDSMEVTIGADGTWFREQPEWRHREGTKLPNQAAKQLFERYMAAEKALQQRKGE